MDDNFLVFQAAHDIQAFEAELVWEYGWVLAHPAVSDSKRQQGAANAEDVGDGDAAKVAEETDGEARAEGSDEADEDDEEAERIRTQGRVLHRAKSFDVVFIGGKIVVLVVGKLKRLPGAVVFTAMSDSIRPTNAWERVTYQMTPKTKISFDGKIVKVSEAMGANVQYIWGYDDPECKIPREVAGAGSAEELFWAPSSKDDLAVADALLDEGSIVRFVMELKTIDDHVMLTPTGVIFSLKPQPIEQGGGKIVELSGQSISRVNLDGLLGDAFTGAWLPSTFEA
jgi:hypothetical protein